ncbi:ApeP family dehydratase [Orbus mooreae]|uniref:ApeP family dehydratase n=1 Tax=Orbus mooreae TaxID=3074107 RepID=UPI00370CFE85
MQYHLAIKYLPHDTPMVMIQDVHLIDEENCICSVNVSKNGILAPFLTPQHTLSNVYVIELMAQTIGVWNGYHGLKNNHQCQLGMLLGGRAIKMELAKFETDSTLMIHAKLVLTDTKLANFDCQISVDDVTVATGKLNVYEPDHLELEQLVSRK